MGIFKLNMLLSSGEAEIKKFELFKKGEEELFGQIKRC